MNNGFLLIIFIIVSSLIVWYSMGSLSPIKMRDHIHFGRNEVRSIPSIDMQMATKYGSI